jgi:Zinc knuckle
MKVMLGEDQRIANGQYYAVGIRKVMLAKISERKCFQCEEKDHMKKDCAKIEGWNVEA